MSVALAFVAGLLAHSVWDIAIIAGAFALGRKTKDLHICKHRHR